MSDQTPKAPRTRKAIAGIFLLISITAGVLMAFMIASFLWTVFGR